ncbi:hypothetical protein PsYK624_051060 [Phanerochaete sordida]|uniref:Secreted protein n=1 Tax=Phanerochaete sordida TaxID=48140 RepID=A0A9P3G4I9_9APHY|nr:hypothetical protein PsYK624_051060 [Phanerochaete sordida]
MAIGPQAIFAVVVAIAVLCRQAPHQSTQGSPLESGTQSGVGGAGVFLQSAVVTPGECGRMRLGASTCGAPARVPDIRCGAGAGVREH